MLARALEPSPRHALVYTALVPTLQIMLPYYQGADYLRQTCLSVAAQSSSAWSLTILDDAGPDGDAETVVRAAFSPQQLEQQVRLLRHETNHGVSHTFNHALQLASDASSDSRGVVTILGSDDLLRPDYVADVLAAALKAPDSFCAIQPGVSVIDANGVTSLPLSDRVKGWLRPHNSSYVAGEYLAASLSFGNWLYFPSLAWNIEAVRSLRFSTRLHTTMDLDFIFRQICNGRGIYLLEKTLFDYRRHPHSVSSQTSTSGARFSEERALHVFWSEQFRHRGWRWAATSARIHPTSRLHRQIAKHSY